jgi:hypothetical protein
MPVADLLIVDEPCIVEQPEMPRDCRPADGQAISDLLDRVRLARQQHEDRAAVWLRALALTWSMVTAELP